MSRRLARASTLRDGMIFKGARYLGFLPTGDSSGDDIDADAMATRLLDKNTVQKVKARAALL